MPDLLSLAQQIRRAVEREDERALNRIIAAFRDRTDILEGDIDALARDLSDPELVQSQIESLPSYKRLIRSINREMDTYQAFLAVEVGLIGASAITLAQKDALRLMAEAGVRDPEQVESGIIRRLLAFLSPSGPLYARLRSYGEQEAARIASLIVSGVRLGENPRIIARWIVWGGMGVALTDAMRIVRTVQLYSYREATRANYIANSNVVRGWVWMSALIPGRTCMSCVAMHGTEHELSETLNDHHNGLCAMLPLVDKNPITQLGEAWFVSQSPAVQRQMMGPGKYEAWQSGKFAFSALTTIHSDEVYGDMRVEQTLQGLIGQ